MAWHVAGYILLVKVKGFGKLDGFSGLLFELMKVLGTPRVLYAVIKRLYFTRMVLYVSYL